ncbi:YesL family protein [Enterococcus timonensis]|uniref:YesL family protein n=1 Tax=Enterococcus timonensis TaxID=1852364 RepID=UPI0008D9DB1B|nr:DUF624 domain-containing protein [Enterococcus timonensis]
MESSGIQRLFYLGWTIIKLNSFFWIFAILGLGIFGIGPSLQSVNDLFFEYRMDYQELTLARMWQRFKINFKMSLADFYIFAAFWLVVGYNLYLALQMTGIIWLAIAFLLIFFLVLSVVAYDLVIVFRSQFQISRPNILKLAIISLFMHLGTLLRLVFGFVSLIVLTYFFKGLIVFATVSLWLIWGQVSTQKMRVMINDRLVTDE